MATGTASTISAISPAAVTGGSITVRMARSSSKYYHRLTAIDKFINQQPHIVYLSDPFATTHTFSVPDSWFENYPNTDRFDLRVSVQTFTNSACTTTVGNPVGTAVPVTLREGCVPALAAGFTTLTPEGNPTGFTGYIQGTSRARVMLDPAKITYPGGSTLDRYELSCQDYAGSGTGTSWLTDVLRGTNDVTVRVTVVDSRGRQATQETTIPAGSIYPSTPPTVTDVSVFRCDANGDADESGTYFSVQATAGCSSIGGQNSVTLKARTREGLNPWSSAITLTSGAAEVIGGAFSPTLSYDVELTATDAVGKSTTVTAALRAPVWALHFRPGGTGAAFGKEAERDYELELPTGWGIRIGSEGFLEKVYPVGSFYFSASATDPATVFGFGTWTQRSARIYLNGSGAASMDLYMFERTA